MVKESHQLLPLDPHQAQIPTFSDSVNLGKWFDFSGPQFLHLLMGFPGWQAGVSRGQVSPGPGDVGLSLSQTPFSSFCWLRVAQVGTQVLREILDIRNRSMLGVLRCLGLSWTTLLRDAEPAPVHREWLILQSSQESENLMFPGGF